MNSKEVDFKVKNIIWDKDNQFILIEAFKIVLSHVHTKQICTYKTKIDNLRREMTDV